MYINTLASHRNARFLRDTEGGTGGGGEGGSGGGSTGGGASGGSNSGADGGGSSFEAITSQEEFDKRISRRITQERNKYADYDTVKEKAAAFDALDAESRTEHERTVALTREAAERDTAAKFVPRLVKTEFKVAAMGKLSDAQVSALLEDLDLAKYADDKGEPDTDKIQKKVTAVAGARGNGGGGKGPDLGQGGGRGNQSTPKGAAGLAEAQRRFGAKEGAGR